MNNPPCKPWAKLVSQHPEKDHISLFSPLEDIYEGQIKTGCQIYKKSTGDVWIKNLSASPIKIDDNWLEKDEEKEISKGERISFNKDKENDDDENFDYVFTLLNSQSKNANKRNREESLEPQRIPPNPETTKLTKIRDELEQELTCSICMKIFHKCTTLFPCSHTFCSFCLLGAFKLSISCPICRLPPTSVTKNFVVQNLVEVTLKSFPEKGRSKEEIEQKQNELDGVIVKNESWTYIGGYQNGKREGKGNMIRSNGNIYEGSWVSDKREGRGTLILSNGKICRGQWSNDFVQYIDEIIQPEVGVYKGETKDFKMHGQGTFRYYDGNIYEGDFVKGWREGFGKYTFRDGEEYEGSFIKDYREGSGTASYLNGDIYKGEWKDDTREGKGVLAQADGYKYEGVWANGDLQSVEKVYYANGDIYEGEIDIETMQKQGEGVLTSKNGDKYQGNWLNDKQHGNGIEIFKCVIEGVWEEGKIMGEVVMTDANGIRYKAELKRLDQ